MSVCECPRVCVQVSGWVGVRFPFPWFPYAILDIFKGTRMENCVFEQCFSSHPRRQKPSGSPWETAKVPDYDRSNLSRWEIVRLPLPPLIHHIIFLLPQLAEGYFFGHAFSLCTLLLSFWGPGRQVGVQ